MSATSPREVLAALAAAVAADPARWPARDGYQPGPALDGLRDGEWLHVLPAAWKRITGQPGAAVLAVLHGRGDLAVPDSARSKGEWAAKGPRWAGRPTGYRVRLATLAAPPPDPAPSIGQRPRTAADPALALMWAEMPDWRGEIFWRPDEDAGPCPACGTLREAEPSRTTVCCPRCRTLSDYPEVTAYRQQHASGGTVARRAGAAVSPAELARQADEERRAVRRARRDLLTAVERALADRRLTNDTRSDLEDFQQQLAAAATMERVGQLRDQLDGYVKERRSLFAPRARLDLSVDDDDGIVEGQIVEDWEGDEDQAEAPVPDPADTWRPPGIARAVSAIVTAPLALTRGRDYLARDPHIQPPQLEYCVACGAPAPWRVNSAAPTLQQLTAAGGTLPVTVCAEHWPQLQAAGGPGDWHVEDLTRGQLPGGPGRDRASVRALDGNPAPGRPQQINPTIEISGSGPRRKAFAWSS
jgi:hypothetical protein